MLAPSEGLKIGRTATKAPSGMLPPIGRRLDSSQRFCAPPFSTQTKKEASAMLTHLLLGKPYRVVYCFF